ncbi:helix-turn-helix domain-containing protein [Streptantibioticus silvisoli]|uniref:Helix-turn-helix domain-containing protein n=1 Tax=Streptantibioticus silvisoli TaxID=2705255 RepID=A0ABT6W8F7_9ACTN|nr:helix-turn-helix domain-containing protein [Streptantibioticus silvisoli]MDI5965766.1 helix-turn-helix domain-containing protein [Streptantibioticus silvisoli]
MSDTAAVVVAGPQDEKLLDASEVAAALRLSLTSVYRLARSGDLRSHRFGKGKVRPRGLRIPESAVTEYLRCSQIEPEAA